MAVDDRNPPDDGGDDHSAHPAIDPVVVPSRFRRVVLRLALAVVVGIGSGVASAAFLHAMDWATEAFATHRLLLYALPFAGFAVGLVYHYAGRGSSAGNNLILDEIHEPQSWIPRRMAGLIFVATIVTHLFGGSAGREGTAVQMSGSIADGIGRRLRITGAERRILLIASIGAGFGGVFGVPIAGFVFALEVQAIKGLRRSALLPAAIASFVADETVRHLGIHHERLPSPGTVHLTPGLLVKLGLAGLAFGLMSTVFAELMHRVHHWTARLVSWPPARPLLGGFLVIAATLLVGSRAYNGLSLPLIGLSLAGGTGVALGAFALKAVFTALTLGTGFYGGEVTPLFVVGATLGATLGHVLHAPIPLLAAAGLVAVFAGASNTPIASTVLGLELFGLHPAYALVFALACGLSYASSGSGGIYTSQRRERWGFRHQPRTPA